MYVIPNKLAEEYIPLMREFVLDDSIFQWRSEGIEYHIFKTDDGWRFEWDNDSGRNTHHDSNMYLVNAFYCGGLLNEMTLEEWKASIRQISFPNTLDLKELL